LLLVTLEGLPINTMEHEYWVSITREVNTYNTRYSSLAYQLSDSEFGFLVDMTDDNQVNVMTDLKVRMISVINEVFPDLFGSIDQTRLVRKVDLNHKLQPTIKFIEQRIRNQQVPKTAVATQRPLRPGDIDRLIETMNKMGGAPFIKEYVISQPIVCINKKYSKGIIASHEYFVSIGKVKNQILKEVDFRGSGSLFNHMTVLLDKVLLSSFQDIDRKSRRSSINLNVENVFTREFRKFVSDLKIKNLSEVILEFRQEDIVSNYGNFLLAQELITEYKGSIAIDGISVDTIGLVNMLKVRPNSIKIFWREGAEKGLEENASEVKNMLNSGIKVVLARVDDEEAVNLGKSLGIELFQGFYIDKQFSFS
jgi:EAL domain-containing protein (putative c-di-GMP-specific phosphodiesterase class I)